MKSFYSLLLFVLLITGEMNAQQPFQVKEVPREEILLTGWKMYAGDDPQFADSNFNDSNWQTVDLTKDVQDFSALKKTGIVWVRLRFSVDRNIAAQQLSAYVVQYTASQIYLNGHVLKEYGTISNDPKTTVAYLPSSLPFDLNLVPGAENVIAARLAYQQGIPYISYMNGNLPALGIYINNSKDAVKQYHYSQRQSKMHVIIFSVSAGMLLIIGFIYLVYFFFDRSQKVHLYYALGMLIQSLNALPIEVWGTERYGTIGPIMWVFYMEAVAYSVSMLFILLTIYTIFKYPHRSLFKLLVVITVIVSISMYWYGTIAFFLISYAFPALYLLPGAYACIWAMKRNVKNAGYLLVGVLLFASATILSAFIPVNSVSSQLIFYFSQMCFPIGMSFYLGIQSSITNKRLRNSLEEVQTLSDKTLAQEQEKQLILTNQNEVLEQQVATRTAELNQSLIDLKSAQSQLVQAEKMASLGELTAGIAHEIQNPLNFVNNFSEINAEMVVEVSDAIDKGNYADAKTILGDIKDNSTKISHHGKRADAIVKGMLQHSQSSKGQREPTDINALCDEYLRLSYHGLRAKDHSFNAKLETHFDENIGQVNVVPQDIGRVIMNLLTNAFYAVDDKKRKELGEYNPVVAITTTKNTNSIEIKISDNGNGIPAAIKEKIFQPFFTTKPTGQGTGLGLSLSYDIITAHQGKIEVKTVEGKGTDFIIMLPK